ncbi:MAG: PhzF family phenazine biosynthesis protein [Muribaculaceae bacterium]|nr:PhzF family phenazine biosynthesis protein [Muribaculaceae bacterium]MBR0023424.1 PhzF family phenazine biosynthesis protein [Muribaculaceae bacterium]
MRYYIVDAFTSEPFGGNTAGVVMLEDGIGFPSDAFMQQVAAEFRYSETAFVKRHGDNEFTVRYFTGCGEVDLCGHATVATFGVLAQTGAVPAGTMCLNHTLAGDLKVEIAEKVMMEMASPQVLPAKVDEERLHRIMGVEDMQINLPAMVVSTGLPDIMMPVQSIDELNTLNIDMDALAQLSKELGVTGVHAFAIGDDDFTAHVRNFGPLYGIPEESATGTANAALTHYLHHNGIITAPAVCRFLQGETMGRPSTVETSLHDDGTIWAGGKSAIIAAGELLI